MKLWKWIFQEELNGKEITYIDIANFRRRNYVHFRDEVASCKVRLEEKQQAQSKQVTLSRPLANYVRGLLLEEHQIITWFSDEYSQMYQEDYTHLVGLKDQETLEALPPKKSFLLSQIVLYMTRQEVIEKLDLHEVVSTKLRGYEKELFWFRCLGNYIQPVVVLRVGVRLLGKDIKIPSMEPIELYDLI